MRLELREAGATLLRGHVLLCTVANDARAEKWRQRVFAWLQTPDGGEWKAEQAERWARVERERPARVERFLLPFDVEAWERANPPERRAA